MANKNKRRLLSLKGRTKKQTNSKQSALERAKGLVKKQTEQDESSSSVRITNETVAKHREEVLSGARRFIYPLQYSKHRIAIVSTVIVVLILAALLAWSWFLLYRQQSTSDFAYRISQIVPFPVARVDGTFVRYEEYLFELRHNIHYLATQENVDFTSEEGQLQLQGLREQAMDKTIERAVVKKMAKERGVRVTNQEVEEQIDLIRSQGGIGDSSQTLEDTLDDFYGWGLADLRRVIRSQLLKQKLIPLLDTEARPRAEQVLNDLQNGADFAEMAKKHSDDELTKNEGGDLGYIFRSNTDLPPQLVEKAFSLAEDEVADELVETLFGLHIVKNLGYRGQDEARVAHILFRYKDISVFVDQYKETHPITKYIDIQ